MKELYMQVEDARDSPDSVPLHTSTQETYCLPRRAADALAVAGYLDIEHSNGNAAMLRLQYFSWLHRVSNCLVIEDEDVRLIFGRTPTAPNLAEYGAQQTTQLVTCKVCLFDYDARRFYQWDGQYVCGNCYHSMRQEHRMSIRDYVAQRNLATPRWCDHLKIKAIYEKAREMTALTDIPHHVDHIIPLRSKKVSGLHVPWNLRVIPALDNLRKGNRLVE